MSISARSAWFVACMFPVLVLSAGDDVYDEHTPKKVKVKPSESVSAPSTTAPAPAFGDGQYSSGYYDEDPASGSFSSYTDRIQQFHQPSVGFSMSVGGYYGYGGYNNYYDPFYGSTGWYNPGWNQSYWFTPSPYWNYYNYWNPFSTTVVVINHPWQMNWGWGYYDPWSPFSWNYGWYNSWYNPWYNPWNTWWTPACHYYVHNNWGWDYGYNHRNVVYGPRTGISTNSPYNNPSNKPSNGNNYQYNINSNKSGTVINKQNKTIEPARYDQDNGNGSNYKPRPYQQPQPQQQAPVQQNWGTRETDSGIKVTKQPK